MRYLSFLRCSSSLCVLVDTVNPWYSYNCCCEKAVEILNRPTVKAVAHIKDFIL